MAVARSRRLTNLAFSDKVLYVVMADPSREAGSTYSGACRMNVSTVVKQPSAFLPVAMSLAALGTLLVHVALFCCAREADEGAAAHIWQLLMAGQVPIVAYFAIKWLPRAPGQALAILALQVLAALAALAPVFYLKL